MLFDSNARSWRQSDIKKLQSVADRCYRFIWNYGKGMALIIMQEEKTNRYEIRRQLNITSIRTKIETRCLQRIGHVLRMPNHRLTKQVGLGHWKKERISEGRLNGGILKYWRRMVKETGENWTNLENLCKDRKRWKAIISKRRKFLREWEESMCKHTREDKPQRNQTRITKDLTCRWEGCGKKCKTKTSLVQQERKIHKGMTKKHKCPKCRTEFKEYTNLTNHVNKSVRRHSKRNMFRLRKESATDKHGQKQTRKLPKPKPITTGNEKHEPNRRNRNQQIHRKR